MDSESTTAQSSLMLSALYVALEAGFFFRHRFTNDSPKPASGMRRSKESRLESWKRELGSSQVRGAGAVDEWVTGWFMPHEGRKVEVKEIKRGNIEEYLSERILGQDLNHGLDDSTRHHTLIGLVSRLERIRNRRFPSGTNTDLRLDPADGLPARTAYQPLALSFVGWLFGILYTLVVTRTEGTAPQAVVVTDKPQLEVHEKKVPPAIIEPPAKIIQSVPHLNTTTRAIPESSLAMVASLSNLSSIGMCAAPPLRTRQRSRTIDAVIACAQVPVSSLAMMSSLSNLSSIGMCAAPPLRTRQRSRGATLVVGYASAVPFTPPHKVALPLDAIGAGPGIARVSCS